MERLWEIARWRAVCMADATELMRADARWAAARAVNSGMAMLISTPATASVSISSARLNPDWARRGEDAQGTTVGCTMRAGVRCGPPAPLRVATGRAQPEPKHRFGRWRRPATRCGAGLSINPYCRTEESRLACRRTVPRARSALGLPIRQVIGSMRDPQVQEVCRLLDRAAGAAARADGWYPCRNREALRGRQGSGRSGWAKRMAASAASAASSFPLSWNRPPVRPEPAGA